MPSIAVHQLMQNPLPDARKDGQMTVLALSLALSAQNGRPVPWSVMRQAPFRSWPRLIAYA
jgi:hypothetical protein